MTLIAHISDLHFGRIDQTVADALALALLAAQPEILVVSGDLTQRARTEEFVAAKAFLDGLPFAKLVVPGNHDVPLYNLFKRAFLPLSRYRRYIQADTDPFLAVPNLAIAGINTARSLKVKGGRINCDQLEDVARRFAGLPESTARIVVTHHPFEGAMPQDDDGIVGRADRAMNAFSRSQVDLILSGHLHLNRIGLSAVRYKIEGYSALLLQAGTAISSRRREEANSFNLIHIRRPDVQLECRSWDFRTSAFVTTATEHFRLGITGWRPAGDSSVETIVQDAGEEVIHSEARPIDQVIEPTIPSMR